MKKPDFSPERESDYQRNIMKALAEAFPDAFIWKAAAGPYGRGGIPDICMVYKGHFFGFEVKRPGGKPTELQKRTIKAINDAGGDAMVVNFPEEARGAVRTFERMWL